MNEIDNATNRFLNTSNKDRYILSALLFIILSYILYTNKNVELIASLIAILTGLLLPTNHIVTTVLEPKSE